MGPPIVTLKTRISFTEVGLDEEESLLIELTRRFVCRACLTLLAGLDYFRLKKAKRRKCEPANVKREKFCERIERAVTNCEQYKKGYITYDNYYERL